MNTGMQLNGSIHHLPSLTEVGLKLGEAAVQLGNLPLKTVSSKMVSSGKPVSHSAELRQTVVHALVGNMKMQQ